MHKSRIFYIIFIFLFNCILVFAGEPEKNESCIVLGAIYDLTGTQAILGKESVKGAEVAVDEINSSGGLLGKKLKLDVRDGRTDTKTISTEAKAFADDKNVIAVVGLSDTNMAYAAGKVLAEKDKIFITSAGTSPLLTVYIPKYLILACYGDNVQAAAAAEFAYTKLRARKVLILFDDEMDYSVGLSKYFKETFKKLGGKISVVAFGHRKFIRKLELEEFKKFNPDVIYLACGPDEVNRYIEKLRKEGFSQPILGGDSFVKVEQEKLPKEYLNSIFYTTHAHITKSTKNKLMKKFISEYLKKYKSMPESPYSVLAYDSIKLLAYAISKSKNTKSS